MQAGQVSASRCPFFLYLNRSVLASIRLCNLTLTDTAGLFAGGGRTLAVRGSRAGGEPRHAAFPRALAAPGGGGSAGDGAHGQPPATACLHQVRGIPITSRVYQPSRLSAENFP